MSSPKRVSRLLNHYESLGDGCSKIQGSDNDTKPAGLEKELKEIQEAPVVIESVVSLNTKPFTPRIPPRPTHNGTRSGGTQQQSTPPSSPLGDSFILESQNRRIETESIPNRPPTPISPTTTSASKRTSRSTRPRNDRLTNDHLDGDSPSHQLQDQLDEVKAEIDQLKLQREESDRKVAWLEAQLERAQDRAQEAASQNAGLREDIAELRARLRDARDEEKKLNNEIRDMMTRERELIDEILGVRQAGRRDGGLGEGVAAMPVMKGQDEEGESKQRRGAKKGKEREKDNVELIMVRPIQFRKQSKPKRWRW